VPGNCRTASRKRRSTPASCVAASKPHRIWEQFHAFNRQSPVSRRLLRRVPVRARAELAIGADCDACCSRPCRCVRGSQSYYAPLELSGNDPQYKLDALLQSTSISAEATIKRGSPEEAVVRTAERTGAALLVIGRRSRAGESDVIDAGKLIRRSPCPVVFRPRQPSAAVCFWTEWQQEEHAAETRSSPDLVPELSL